MTITCRSLASTLLLTAVTISTAFQLYRAGVGTNPAVDSFGVEAAIAYAFLFGVALVVRADRRWIWWAVAALITANLVYGVVGYNQTVYDARPMGLLDLAEGTLYTGLLLAALGCAVLRLTGTTLAPGAPGRRRSPVTAPHAAPARSAG